MPTVSQTCTRAATAFRRVSASGSSPTRLSQHTSPDVVSEFSETNMQHYLRQIMVGLGCSPRTVWRRSGLPGQ